MKEIKGTTRWASWLYSKLLILYPRAFRAEFGPEMLQTFEDYYREVCQARERGRIVVFWVEILTDWGRSVVIEQVATRFKKRSSIMLESKLSLIIPAYNEAESLERTVIEALTELSQSFKEQEIIIVNDGSHDATGRVADRLAANYPAQIRVIHHKTNRGYRAALKAGIKAANGEHLMYHAKAGQTGFLAHASRLVKPFTNF